MFFFSFLNRIFMLLKCQRKKQSNILDKKLALNIQRTLSIFLKDLMRSWGPIVFNACSFYDKVIKFIVLDKIRLTRPYAQRVKKKKEPQNKKYEYEIKVTNLKEKRKRLESEKQDKKKQTLKRSKYDKEGHKGTGSKEYEYYKKIMDEVTVEKPGNSLERYVRRV